MECVLPRCFFFFFALSTSLFSLSLSCLFLYVSCISIFFSVQLALSCGREALRLRVTVLIKRCYCSLAVSCRCGCGCVERFSPFPCFLPPPIEVIFSPFASSPTSHALPQAKRSEPILAFLAKRNAVSTSQLDLLWSSTVGKHEVGTTAKQHCALKKARVRLVVVSTALPEAQCCTR